MKKRRAAQAYGQIDEEIALRPNLHWAVGLIGGLVLSIPLEIIGSIDEATNAQIVLLIIAVVHFLAGAQLRKLEDAGYVTTRKTFQGRKPVSWYKLSTAGKKALKARIGALSTLLESAFSA